MKINLIQIPDGGMNLEGELPASIMEWEGADFRFEEPVHYDVRVQVDENGVVVYGRLWTTVQASCGRCAEYFPMSLEVKEFAVHQETKAESVDLTGEVREDILLTLPLVPKCELTQKNTCPFGKIRWDASKTKTIDRIHEQSHDPEGDGRKVWGALDEIKIQPKRKK
ncbi:MAG: hypothetical protein SFY92_03295 [Verrucomicrobiae bacterium]|nr:hypothetical protein [Verrucomicrobiae bacterium]